VQESPSTLTLYSLSSGFELEAPYSASNCKKQDMSGCAWEARIYVQAEGKARALLIDRANNTRAWRYLHHDHLGSVTLVTDQAGVVQARYGFDAWGARRNANGTAQTGTIAPEVDRGYTGHEMLDNVGIVHMNGRLYDPQIARMISADPTIPHPENLQAYSRYAYVYNDPLNKWDPSGYKPNKWFKLAAALAIAVFAPEFLLQNFGTFSAEAGMTLSTTFSASNYTVASQVLAGAASGFAGGLVASGGDFRSAATGALTGGMFAGAAILGASSNVAGQMALHAGAGCISGALGGGGAEGCARGALSQVVSKAVTIGTRDILGSSRPAHFASAVIAGGTASAVTGGKFANGAITGAFGYVLNELGQIATAERARVREKMAGEAESYNEIAAFTRESAWGPIPANSDKCNLFVYVCGKVAGLNMPEIVTRWGWGSTVPATTTQWSNANYTMGDWAVVYGGGPARGDIIISGGHMGIMVAPNLTASATATRVRVNDWGFRPAQQADRTVRTFVGSDHSSRYYQ
jgi:RHS repeat-associated protein